MLNKKFSVKKTIFYSLVTICLSSLVVNNVLVSLHFFSRDEFPYRTQILILFFVIFFIYVFEQSPFRWFGDTLAEGHEVNILVTRIFAIFCILPEVLFSLVPWIHLAAKRHWIS